jgi:hypothetical protein
LDVRLIVQYLGRDVEEAREVCVESHGVGPVGRPLRVIVRGVAAQPERAFYESDEWRHGPREAIVSRIEDDYSVALPRSALLRAPTRHD